MKFNHGFQPHLNDFYDDIYSIVKAVLPIILFCKRICMRKFYKYLIVCCAMALLTGCTKLSGPIPELGAAPLPPMVNNRPVTDVLPETMEYADPTTVFSGISFSYGMVMDPLFSDIEESSVTEGTEDAGAAISDFYSAHLMLISLNEFDNISFSDTADISSPGAAKTITADDVIECNSFVEYDNERDVPQSRSIGDSVYRTIALNLKAGTLYVEESVKNAGRTITRRRLEMYLPDDGEYCVRMVTYESDKPTKIIALRFNNEQLEGGIAQMPGYEEDYYSLFAKTNPDIDDMMGSGQKQIAVTYMNGIVTWQKMH